jgi:hypothetical protein
MGENIAPPLPLWLPPSQRPPTPLALALPLALGDDAAKDEGDKRDKGFVSSLIPEISRFNLFMLLLL